MRPCSVGRLKIASPGEALSDVIGPVELIEEILKTPYSKSRISIAVQRTGRTIVLNFGPNVQEAEKLLGKENNFRKNLRVFSIEDYIKTSLCLSPVIKQTTKHTDWLRTSVSELAIWNDQNSVVPEDAPDTVQQNGLAVRRFLHSNCKDPGVYWLYRSAGEDMIELFDLSDSSSKHWSEASSFPLVVRACAHEQYARLVNEDKFDFKSNNLQRKIIIADPEKESLDPGMSSTSGQDPPPLQTSLQRAAISHVIQSIETIMEMRRQLTEEKVELFSSVELDGKLWSLILLLGESYLSLGEAYKEQGELQEALNIVELACSIYGAMPHNYGELCFVSGLYKSFSQLLRIQTFEMWVGSVQLTTTELDYHSVRELSPLHLFWAKVWLLVGDIYAKFVVCSPDGSEEVTKEEVKKEEVASHIAAEVEMLKKKLPACKQKCASCSLVNCLCSYQMRKGKGENKFQNRKSKGEVRGGIFKYLTRSREGGEERIALDCYEQTQKALGGFKELLHPLHQRIGWVWSFIGYSDHSNSKFKEAEEAYVTAARVFSEIGDHISVIETYYNYGAARGDLATLKKEKMKSLKEPTKKAHQKALQAATEEYFTSLRFYMTAKRVAHEEDICDPEGLKIKVVSGLADTYFQLGGLLCEEDTTVALPLELKTMWDSTHDSSPTLLSGFDFRREGIDLLKSLGDSCRNEVTQSLYTFAHYHMFRSMEFSESNLIEKANDQASFAYEYWQESLECYGPERRPDQVFAMTLIDRSFFCFNRPRPANFFQMLESDLSLFLRFRHISEEEEKSLGEDCLKVFWITLRKILLEMLTMGRSLSASEGDNRAGTLKNLYGISLRATTTSLGSLKEMHDLWAPEP